MYNLRKAQPISATVPGREVSGLRLSMGIWVSCGGFHGRPLEAAHLSHPEEEPPGTEINTTTCRVAISPTH